MLWLWAGALAWLLACMAFWPEWLHKMAGTPGGVPPAMAHGITRGLWALGVACALGGAGIAAAASGAAFGLVVVDRDCVTIRQWWGYRRRVPRTLVDAVVIVGPTGTDGAARVVLHLRTGRRVPVPWRVERAAELRALLAPGAALSGQ